MAIFVNNKGKQTLKHLHMKNLKLGVVAVAMSLCSMALGQEKVTITVKQPEHGLVTITPTIPSNREIAKGTELTVTVRAIDRGWSFDSGYYRPGGRGVYMESMTSEFKVTANTDLEIGGSMIETSRLEGYSVIQDVVYAKPGAKALKYDVFIPDGAKDLPCIVIIHGGGWTSNVEDIMRGEARELIKGGKYVVCSIDYRWVGTLDGDGTPNRMNDLINDCYGAILHIQENAAEYGIDPTRIAVTGDSAGGHLSAAVANMVENVGKKGFGVREGVYEFLPSYLPKGVSVRKARKNLLAIKAAAPSYGLFEKGPISDFVKDMTPEEANAVCPLYIIPDASVRAIPQYLTLGTKDNLIKKDDVERYAEALRSAGQKVELQMVEGASHAFFDWKPDSRTKATFEKYGVPYCADMVRFFDEVFYK